MRKIELHSIHNIDELVFPNTPKQLNVDSKAIEIFTDFKEIPPLLLDDDTPAIEAENYMLHSHVKLKIVVDHNKHFLGLLSLNDLNSQEIIKHVSKGENRTDLTVTDFMRPKSELKALHYEDLQRFTIMDVIQVLKESGQQHCLVVDGENNEIRGIISASDISRKLKLPINISQHSSFVEIFNVLHH